MTLKRAVRAGNELVRNGAWLLLGHIVQHLSPHGVLSDFAPLLLAKGESDGASSAKTDFFANVRGVKAVDKIRALLTIARVTKRQRMHVRAAKTAGSEESGDADAASLTRTCPFTFKHRCVCRVGVSGCVCSACVCGCECALRVCVCVGVSVLCVCVC